MNKICEKYILNLKTGFFKTEAYALFVQEDSLRLAPGNKDSISGEVVIKLGDIKTISISDELPFEIEIRTDKTTFVGAFSKTADISEIDMKLKQIFSKRYISY